MNKTAFLCINYFSSQLIDELLREFFVNLPHDVFVIDNSVNEIEYNNLCALSENTKIQILRSEENNGFGKTIDRFLSQTKEYQTITIINPDINPVLLSDFNSALKAFIDSEYCYFQPVIFDRIRKTKSIQGLSFSNSWSIFFEYTLFKFLKPKRLVQRSNSLKEGLNEIYVPSGAFLTIKCDKLVKINGFPTETFMYYEEWLLAEKLRRVGENKLGYIQSNLEVEHIVGGTTKSRFGQFNPKMEAIRIKSLIIVCNEIFGKNLFIRLIIKTDILLRSLLNLLISTYVKLKR